MTDWTRVTPETLAELRRLLTDSTIASPGPWRRIGERVDDCDRFEVGAFICEQDAALVAAAVNALPALLDAAAERDRLARLLDEPRRSGCAVEIAGVRIAPCDERGQTADMRALDTAACSDYMSTDTHRGL